MKIIIKKSAKKVLNEQKDESYFIESWNNLLNEGAQVKRSSQKFIIDTIHGKKEVTASLVSEHWFATKDGGKFYTISHKASGRKIPFQYYYNVPKYKTEKKDRKGRVTLVTSEQNMKDLMTDLENNLNFPDLNSENPSESTIMGIVQFFKDLESEENTLNEFVSQDTASSFEQLAAGFGELSALMADDAKESERIQDFVAKLDVEGLDQVNNLEQLLKNVKDGSGVADLAKGLADAGIEEKDVGQMLMDLRTEFDEYREEQGKKEEEREKAQKDADREQAQDEMSPG